MKIATALALALGVAGCGAGGGGRSSNAAQAPVPGHTHDPRDHNHARGKMLMASDGTTNAFLTAHLSATDGNELDVFVEKEGSPRPLETSRLRAIVAVEGAARPLDFACAPAAERPAGEAEQVCSHFVARSPWIKPSDTLLVVAQLPLAGREVPFVWYAFEPRRYAHHVD